MSEIETQIENASHFASHGLRETISHQSITLRLWLEHLGLELPPASTLSDNLNAVCNQTRSLIHRSTAPELTWCPLRKARLSFRRTSS